MKEYHVSRVVALVAFTFMQVHLHPILDARMSLIPSKGISWDKRSEAYSCHPSLNRLEDESHTSTPAQLLALGAL
jgi:hypothetical protein